MTTEEKKAAIRAKITDNNIKMQEHIKKAEKLRIENIRLNNKLNSGL